MPPPFDPLARIVAMINLVVLAMSAAIFVLVGFAAWLAVLLGLVVTLTMFLGYLYGGRLRTFSGSVACEWAGRCLRVVDGDASGNLVVRLSRRVGATPSPGAVVAVSAR